MLLCTAYTVLYECPPRLDRADPELLPEHRALPENMFSSIYIIFRVYSYNWFPCSLWVYYVLRKVREIHKISPPGWIRPSQTRNPSQLQHGDGVSPQHFSAVWWGKATCSLTSTVTLCFALTVSLCNKIACLPLWAREYKIHKHMRVLCVAYQNQNLQDERC